MKSRKSQGLPVNYIIIAVIALVALVVVLAIFANFTGDTAKNINSCTAKGGKCANKDGKCDDKEYPIPLFLSEDCEKENNICCLKKPGEEEEATTEPPECYGQCVDDYEKCRERYGGSSDVRCYSSPDCDEGDCCCIYI